MKSRVLGCLGTAAVALLVLSIALNVFFLLFSFGGSDRDHAVALREEVVQKATTKGAVPSAKIAQIEIAGLIANDEILPGAGGADIVGATKRSLAQALEDDAVKAIVLRIDSPGGEVTASDTIYHAVKEAQKKKPVIAYMDSVAASGGFYVACGAQKIVANQNTWTGSIGVVVQTLRYGDALAKLGLEMRVFRSGNFKDTFYGQRPITPEEEAYVQKMVADTYERFVGIVADSRRLPLDKLKTEIADGRIFSGAEAASLSLIDRTGYIEDAYALAKEAAGVKDAEVVRYQRHVTLADLLGMGVQAAAEPRRVQVELPQQLLPKLQPGRCYLIPSQFIQ